MPRARDDREYKITRPDGSVYYQRRIWTERDPLSGKRRQVTVKAPTLRAFRAAIADAQRARPLSELTLADYLTKHWLPHKEASGRCGANSLRAYRSHVADHLIPALGSVRLDQLQPLAIQAWINREATTGAPASVGQYLTILRMALKQAVIWRMLPHNPCDGVTTPQVKSAPRQVWTVDELETFLTSTSTDATYHALWCVLGRGGLRIGEARALYWSDLDAVTGVLHVRRTMTTGAGGETIGATTKTGEARDVQLDPATLDALTARPRVSLRIFPCSRSASVEALATACAALGWEKVTPHDFRHMHVTHCVRAGMSPMAIRARLGHSSAVMTELYSHPDLADQREVVERMYGRAVKRINQKGSRDTG